MNQNSTNYRAPSLQQMGHLPGQPQQQVNQQQAYANPSQSMRPRMQQRYVTPAGYQQALFAYQPQIVTAPFGYPQGAAMSAQHAVQLPQTQQIGSHPGVYYSPVPHQMYQVGRPQTPVAHPGYYSDGRQQQPPQAQYTASRVATPHMNPTVSYAQGHPQAQHTLVSPMAPAQPQQQQQPQAPQHQVQQPQAPQPQQQQIPVHQQPSNQSQIQQQSQHVQSHTIPQTHYQRVDGPGPQPRVHVGDQSQGQGQVGHTVGGPGGNLGSKDTGTITRKKRILNIVDPASGKNVFNEKENDASAPDSSKEEDKKGGAVATEPLEVSVAGLAISSTPTTVTPVVTTGGGTDPASVSSKDIVRESTPVLPGSTADDSSSKTKVKSEFFNKISQANDDNKKPKSDEAPVSKVNEDLAGPPTVVATASPPATTSSITVSAAATTTTTTTTPSPTSPVTTEAVPTASPSPPTPATPATPEELPATPALETPPPTLPVLDDKKPDEVATAVPVASEAVPEIKTLVNESTTPSIDLTEKIVTPPTPITTTTTEDEKIDEEIAKININKIEPEKALTNGIEKLDEDDQENVPLSDSHELSTVSISPTPIEAYCGDNSVRSQDDSTVGESNLNEETNEVTEVNPVLDTNNVDADLEIENESETDALLEDGEIPNDKEDDEDDQNDENETPKRILQYDRDLLLRIGRSTATSKNKIDIQIADVVKDGKNNNMDKIGGYGPRNQGTPVNHQSNTNYRNRNPGKDPRNLGMGPIMHPQMRMGQWGIGGPLAIPPTPPRGPGPRVIEIQAKVELSKAENAWKPSSRNKNRLNVVEVEATAGMTPDEMKTQEIVKQTRGILNKLTPENFNKLLDKFLKLELNDREDRISAVILVVFEKAIDEPSFSTAYARMVQHVCQHSQETAKKFRKEILDQCQKEFQKTNKDEDEIKAAEKEIVTAPDDKKDQLKLELEEKRFQLRRRSLGNVRFIGELYKLQMLTPKIMVDCVHMLLGSQDEESLECLCKLLTTVGQKLDNQLKEIEHRAKQAKSDSRTAAPKFIPDPHFMDNTFNKLRKLSSETSKLSSRIRFALLDAVELRENDWKPRRDSNAPKTIEEVRRDAARQEQEEKRQINALPDVNMSQRRPSPMNQQGSLQQKKSDWNTVQSNKSSRFSQVKKTSESSNSPVLAPPVTLGWGGGPPTSRGSSSSNKSQIPPRFQQQQQLQNQQGSGGQQHNMSSRFGPNQSSQQQQQQQPQPTFGNRFSALSNQSNSAGINLAPGGGGGSTGGPPPQLIQSLPQQQQHTQPPPSQPPQQQPREEPYSTANIDETVKNIFQEFLSVKKFEDTMHWIKSRFPGDRVLDFVDTLARQVGEMSKESQQCGAGQLIKMLIKQNVVQRNDALDAISKGVIQDIPDIEVDVPKVTSYMAMFILEIFGDESNLNWLIVLSQPLKAEFEETWNDLIGATLNLFKLKRDKPYVKSLWSSTKDKDVLLIESLPWLSDESVSSLVNKMIPVLEQNEREEIINIFKEKSWDLRESGVSSALMLAICEVSYVSGKWDVSKLEKYLPLLSKPQGPDLWKIVKDQFLQKKGVGKEEEQQLWTRLLNSKLVDP